MRRLSILLTLFIFIGGAISQDAPKAVLIDEEDWGKLGCEEIINRIDTFFVELSNHPDSSGLVVLSGPADKKVSSAYREATIEDHTKWRNFDKARYRILKTTSDTDPKVQFWLLPAGAKEPGVANIDMTYALPRTIKPFMAGSVRKYGPEICTEPDNAKIFAILLKDNPSARGNIVARAKSLRLARSRATSFVRRFQRQYGIDAKRLRTFPALLTQPRGVDEAVMEYWYLP